MARIHFDGSTIDIRMDNVFKAVFTSNTRESRGALAGLLSALIGREVEIVEILENEPAVSSRSDRQIRFDINCLIDKTERANVEMTVCPHKYEPVRGEWNLAVLHAAQNIKGEDRDYGDIQTTYQITIYGEKVYEDAAFFHRFEYYDSERGISMGGKTRALSVELSKLEGIVLKSVDEMTSLERWAVFLEYRNDEGKREKVEEILRKEEGVKMANVQFGYITGDEAEKLRMISKWKYELDRQSEISYAKKEGARALFDLIQSGKSPEEALRSLGA